MSSAPPPFLQSHPSPFNSAAVSTSEPQFVSPFFIGGVIVGVFAIVLCACFRLRSLFIHSLSSSPSTTSPSPPTPADSDPTTVIQSLPLFSLSSLASPSSLNKLVGSDCAVCLSRFQTSDELRLLPSCCHAFHSNCIDPWLHQNLTCPLCRKYVYQVPPSESFKIEIGNVSCRSTASATDAVRSRSYSFGSFEYAVEGEIDAVVSGIQTREIHNVGPIGLGDDVAADGIGGTSSSASSPQNNDNDSTSNSINNDINVGPIGLGDDVATDATGGTSSCLQDYSGCLTSSASSRQSNYNDCTSNNINHSDNWDLETNLHILEEEDSVFTSIHRWFVGI